MSPVPSHNAAPAVAAPAAAPTRCWSCGGPVAATLFCPTCRAVQPPGDLDPFARLGFPAGFALDRAELDRRYFAAQRQLHPDRFATRSPRERAISQRQAVSLNDAYETLKDPLARACALLRLAGVAATPDRDHTVSDPALLMEQMDRREALAETDRPEEAARVEREAAGDMARTIDAIGAAFARDDIPAATRETTRLRYLAKLAEDARVLRQRLAARAGREAAPQPGTG
jgi:molecular chaperone HscB